MKQSTTLIKSVFFQLASVIAIIIITTTLGFAQCNMTGVELAATPGVTFPTTAPTFNGTSIVFGTGTADQVVMKVPLLAPGVVPPNADVNLNFRFYMKRIGSDNDPIMLFTDGIGTSAVGWLANDGSNHFKLNGTIAGTTLTITYLSLVSCNGSCGTNINDTYICDLTFDITAGAVSTIDSTFQGVNSQGTTSTYVETFDPSTGINFILGRQSPGETYQIDSVEYMCTMVAPTVNAYSSNATICGGDSTSLFVQAGGFGLSYQWQFNGNDIPGATSSNYVIDPASSADEGSYVCIVSNQSGTDSTGVIQITVSAPEALITGPTSICEGETVTLLGTGYNGTPGFTYMWSNGATTQDITVSPSGDTTFIFTVTDALGCVSPADTLDIIVNPLPIVAQLGLDTTCANYAAFVLSGGTPAGGTYSGIGVAAGMFDPSVAGVGTHTITYTYLDINGCSNTAATDIVVEGCAGIDEKDYAITVVYPNPMNEELTISAAGSFSYSITDAQGRLVEDGNGVNQVNIDTKGYLSGMYVVRIDRNNDIHNFKVVKK